MTNFESALEILEQVINNTPTGLNRDALTEVNILLRTADDNTMVKVKIIKRHPYTNKRVGSIEEINKLDFDNEFHETLLMDNIPLFVPPNKPLDETENMYYIWNGSYLGNDLVWWGVNSGGYTADLNKAGRYSLAFCIKLCRSSDKPIECDYIDLVVPHRTAVDSQKVDYSKFGIK